MRRLWESPVPSALLFLGCAGLGYLALRQHNETVRVNLDFKAVDHAERNHLADLRRQLAAVEAERLKLEKIVAQASSPVVGSGEPLTIHQSDIAKEHPEYAAILARQQRRNVMQQYGDVFAGLHLRSDQLAKLKDLLVERSLTSTDAQQAAKAAGLDQNSAAYRAAIKQATDAVDQELTSVLGQDATAAIQKLQQTANAQRQVQYYAPDFTEAGAPLTSEQTSALTQTILASRSGPVRQNFYKADPATGFSPSDNQMLESAAQVLSPAQLQVMKTVLLHNNQQSAIIEPYFEDMAGPNRSISIQP